MNVSDHARKRMQQRAIPSEWLWLLNLCGESSPQKGGTQVLRLSKAITTKLRAVLKQLDHLENVYVVVGEDGHVITTAHQFHPSSRKHRSFRVWKGKHS